MTRYRHLHGESGVSAYEIGPRSITVRFADGKTYRYTHAKTGLAEVEAMKALAAQGNGLATFINQHVRGNYERRMR